MEIKYFKLLVTVAETGSLKKAADKLFLTPSALSHQLKELESQTKSPLFKRINKSLVLTNSGQILLRYGYSILNEIKKLEAEIQHQKAGETGTIKLTTESSTCYHWLPKILKRYQQSFPNVEVSVNSGPLNDPLRLLLTGKVDIAIMHTVKMDKNIAYKEFLKDEVVALVPANDLLATRTFLKPEDFSQLTYITHSKNLEESAFFSGFFKPHGITPKKVIYFQLTEAIIEMVKEGLGVAVMSSWLAKPYVDSGAVTAVRITKPGLKRKWMIASLKNDQPKYLATFIEYLTAGNP
jgi:LysR family transcriptional regulator for metE and metH